MFSVLDFYIFFFVWDQGTATHDMGLIWGPYTLPAPQMPCAPQKPCFYIQELHISPVSSLVII